MTAVITVIHVIVSFVLILVILLQAGKGGGVGAALGGGGSSSVFGGRGAQTFLGKVTSVCAGIFMLTSLTLAYRASTNKSVVTGSGSGPATPAPAGTPAAPSGAKLPSGSAPAAPAEKPVTTPAPAAPAAPKPAK